MRGPDWSTRLRCKVRSKNTSNTFTSTLKSLPLFLFPPSFTPVGREPLLGSIDLDLGATWTCMANQGPRCLPSHASSQ
jgi:hypothetical protein